MGEVIAGDRPHQPTDGSATVAVDDRLHAHPECSVDQLVDVEPLAPEVRRVDRVRPDREAPLTNPLEPRLVEMVGMLVSDEHPVDPL